MRYRVAKELSGNGKKRYGTLEWLDGIINLKQPETLSALWEETKSTGWLLEEIKIARYLGGIMGVRIKVRDEITGKASWLPSDRTKVYSIFR